MCLWLCAISVHNTAQNSSDNLSSYLQSTIIAQMLSIGGKRGHQEPQWVYSGTHTHANLLTYLLTCPVPTRGKYTALTHTHARVHIHTQTWIATRGELMLYHSGIPNRLSCAVRGWKVCEQRVLTTLPPGTQRQVSASGTLQLNYCNHNIQTQITYVLCISDKQLTTLWSLRHCHNSWRCTRLLIINTSHMTGRQMSHQYYNWI